MPNLSERKRAELAAIAASAVAALGLTACSSDEAAEEDAATDTDAETAEEAETAAEESADASDAEESGESGEAETDASDAVAEADDASDAEASGSESPIVLGDTGQSADAEDDASEDGSEEAAGADDAEAGTETDEGEESATAESGDDPITVIGDDDPLTLTDPAAFGIPSLGWAGIGLVAGLAVAAAAYGISRALGRGKGKAAAQQVAAAQAAAASTPPGFFTVEKLHDQGARDSQQDSFYVSAESAEDNLLVIVADGMGGLSDGDKVSQAAVMAAAEAFFELEDADPKRLLVQLIARANQAVNQLLGYQGLYQSGCTFAVGLARAGAFTYASVGDSRIYLVRAGELIQLNREHVYQDELYVEFMNGERPLADADTHPKKAGLTSFLGMGELKYVDLPSEPVALHTGDRLLLMSDGVYNALPAPELLALVQGAQGKGTTAGERLHGAIQAKAYSNQDNFTAVIVNCE